MSFLVLPTIALATELALTSFGGGIYETVVVDAAWPRNPALVQPELGGLSRKRFWIPAHSLFEIVLVASIFLSWGQAPGNPLLVALGGHAIMRIWSAVDFIPKALAFEMRTLAPPSQEEARAWTRRSLLRLPLDFAVCAAMLWALVLAARTV